MTKRDKREQRIRRNVKQVRLDDLDAVLRDNDFDGDVVQHHVVYHHREYSNLTVNVAKPHGTAIFVKAPYVREAIKAIDEAERRGTA